MDIHKEWDQLDSKLFSKQSLKKEEIMNAISSESSSVIAQLKKGLRIKSYWCLGFIALFAVLMFNSRDNIEQVVVIGIVALLYIIGFFMIYFSSKNMNADIKESASVLSSMKTNAKLIKRAINLESYLFLYTSPVILICSMLFARFGDGAAFADLMQDPSFLKRVIVMCAVMIPFLFVGGNFLNKKSFTPLIEELDKNIHQLEGVEKWK